jgi:hypothetical protein
MKSSSLASTQVAEAWAFFVLAIVTVLMYSIVAPVEEWNFACDRGRNTKRAAGRSPGSHRGCAGRRRYQTLTFKLRILKGRAEADLGVARRGASSDGRASR